MGCVPESEWPIVRRAAETAAAAQRAHNAFASEIGQLAEFFNAATTHRGVTGKRAVAEMEQKMGVVTALLNIKDMAESKAEKAAAIVTTSVASIASAKKLSAAVKKHEEFFQAAWTADGVFSDEDMARLREQRKNLSSLMEEMGTTRLAMLAARSEEASQEEA